MNERNSRKSAVFRALKLFGSVFLAFLIAEVVIRFFPVDSGLYVEPVNEQQPVVRFTPNSEFTYSKDWDFRDLNRGRINNFGFVNDQDYEPTETSPLAAIIGDSYIEAAMVPFGETVQGRLAEYVHRKGRVYSFGMSGASLSQYLAWTSWVKNIFHPDLFAVTVVSGDFDESLLRYKKAPGYYYFDDSQKNMPLVRVDLDPGFLHGRIRPTRISALARYILRNLDLRTFIQEHVSPKSIPDAGTSSASMEADRVARSKRVVDTFLARLPQAAGVAAGKIILVLDGMRPALYSRDGLQKVQGSYSDVMRRYLIWQARLHGYVVIDMQPRFIEYYRASGERLDYLDNGHWNETGHLLVAEAIEKTRPFQELFGF